ncbi:phage major capsid protein [Paremcibacter congregatus]|uniref:phage major capsid protein n=1 Tax=Paremcibacter congregatus TaxID=2043170 RepID=UPI003A907982
MRGIVAVRADATDPTKIVGEIKTAFEEFKKANDDRIAQIEAKGSADVLTNEKVDKINATISDLQAKLGDLSTSQAAMQMSGAASNDDEAKAVKAFARERGQEVSVEDYRAYKDGLNVYMRKGASTPNDVKASLSVGSDPDGGYTVTPDMSGRIIKKVFETTAMRQLASVVSIGTDSIEGFNDLDEADAGWVAEKGTRTETSTPGLGKWSISVDEMYAEPKATQKLLDDSMFDIEGWLADKVANKFSRIENAAFINGDGSGKPRGILDYDTVATSDATRAWEKFEHINTGVSGGFAAEDPADDLIDVVFALKAQYRNNANWLMARKTVASVRKMKDGDGNYLWAPDFGERQGGLVLGYPVVEGEDMPVVAANSLSMAFGDFREAYTIVDRKGITVLRDPFTQKGFVKFYTTRRTGGGAVNFEALKYLRFGT